jgi:hypothetical protein
VRGSAWPLTIFASALALFGVMNRIWESSTIMSATYAFAAGVAYLSAAVSIAVAGREPLRRGAPPVDLRVRAIPAASFGAAVLGLGAGALGLGFVFGTSIVLCGVGMLAAGGFLLARELRAQRRALARER